MRRSTRAVVGDDDDVLDPGAVAAREVDARLDRERHARLEDLGVAGHDVGLLVRLEADAVAGAVDERDAVPAALDDVAGRRVDGLGGDARRVR